MKIISKEKAWFGFDVENCKEYCFEERNDNYHYSFYNYYYKFISDITVNEDNQLHSYKDQPLSYIDEANRLCNIWFINGKNKRLDPEKPRLIIKGHAYYFNNGKVISIQVFKDNLK